MPDLPPTLPPTSGLAQGSAAHPSFIGPYRILRVLGDGGMGMVYEAEQTAPVQRRVALKVVRADLDSREVLARFETERQALALMSHESIAKVLDAGATATGRPFFVMELVPGVPITDYCDRRTLSTRERLALFIRVCRGGPARPPEGRHPPRPQAVQRPGRRCTTAGRAQGDRLRHRQGDRASG